MCIFGRSLGGSFRVSHAAKFARWRQCRCYLLGNERTLTLDRNATMERCSKLQRSMHRRSNSHRRCVTPGIPSVRPSVRLSQVFDKHHQHSALGTLVLRVVLDVGLIERLT